MGNLTTLTYAWGMLHVFASLYYGVLAYLDRDRPEYGWFALTTLGFAAYSFASVALYEADSVETGARAQAVRSASLAGVAAANLLLARKLSGGGGRKLLWLCGGFMVFALAALLLGEMHYPVSPAPAAWGFDSAPSYRLGELAPLGRTVYVVGWFLGAHTLIYLRTAAANQRSVAVLYGTVVVAMAATAHDLLIQVINLRSTFLLEHLFVAATVGMSLVLLERFRAQRQTLERTTTELAHSYSALDSKKVELVQEERLAIMGELSAVIAHELQAPMEEIDANIERLGAPEETEALAYIDRAAERLGEVVGDLLELARPHARPLARINARELLTDTCTHVVERMRLPRTEVKVIALDGGDDFVLMADRESLLKSLVNLAKIADHPAPFSNGVFVATEQPTEAVLEFRWTSSGRTENDDEATSHALDFAIVRETVKRHSGSFDRGEQGEVIWLRLAIPSAGRVRENSSNHRLARDSGAPG